MGNVHTEVVIRRPMREVFAYVTDLRHDPKWYRGIQAVRVLSDVETGVGAVYEQKTRMFGRSFVAELEVTEYEPFHHMQLVSRRSMIPFTATYTFAPVDDWKATRYVLDADVSGTGVYRALGPLFGPVLRHATQSRMKELKRQLEAARD